MNIDPAIKCLQEGGVVVLRTDTLYGILASVNHEKAVERIYSMKGRQNTKPCILLVADVTDVPFDQEKVQAIYKEAKGIPTSIIIPVTNEPRWVTRGSDTIAYRVPENETLRNILRSTGSLIAPSVNPEGLSPARNIEEARAYFGEKVDLYVDSGEVLEDTSPSQIVRIGSDGNTERIR